MRGNCLNSTEKFKPQCCWGDARKGLKEKTKKELRHGLQKTEAPVQGSRWEASPGRLLFGRHESQPAWTGTGHWGKKHLLILGKKFLSTRKEMILLLYSAIESQLWKRVKVREESVREFHFHLVEEKVNRGCIKVKHYSHLKIMLLLLSRFSHVQLCATPYTAAYQAPRPWDSPGKNTGVGCRFLL